MLTPALREKNSPCSRSSAFSALFLTHNSIHNFKEDTNTTESCILSVPEAELLKKWVHQTAQQQNRHPNSVWADLRRKYGFHSYKTIDCQTIKKIKHDISNHTIYNTTDYIN